MTSEPRGGRRQHLIFVSSLGRTGTLFIGEMGRRFIEDCISLHEPDVFDIVEPGNLFEKLRHAGLAHLLLGKLHPRHSVSTLGVHRIAGKLSDDEVVDAVRSLRTGLYRAQDAAVVLESNLQLYLLLDVLVQTFPGSRAAFVIRDPRTWFESWTRYRSRPYALLDARGWFANARLRPSHVGDREAEAAWGRMSRFERICWYWAGTHRLVADQAAREPALRLFRYEDLFLSDARAEHFASLLEHMCTTSVGTAPRYAVDAGLLDVRLHRGHRDNTLRWTQWPADQARSLERICGPVMREWGYGDEPAWRALVSG